MQTKSENIDLSAFDQTPELKVKQAAFMGQLKRKVLLGCLLVVSVFVSGLLYRPIFYIGAVSLIIGSMLLNAWGTFGRNKRISNYYLELFAGNNGLVYEVSPDYSSNGVIFKVGNDNHRTTDLLSGKLYGYPYKLYWHNYTVGHGKNASFYHYEVMEIVLPKKLPQIFVDYKGNNTLGQDILNQFKSRDMIQLEGDFSAHFKVYAIKKYAATVLTILNPAFMTALIDENIDYEIEFIDDRAYIYISGQMIATRDNIMRIYSAAEFLILQLQKQLDTFNFRPDENVSDVMKTSSVKKFLKL